VGHVLMENRNGLAVGAAITRATGTAEREAALALLDRRRADHHITLGADKAYDVTAFVEDLRTRQVTPHIAVDGRVSKLGVVRKTVCRGQWMVLEAAAPSAAASTEPRDAPQTSLGTPSSGDAPDIWRDEVADVTGGPIDYGHYVRQETLNLTLQWFVRHFGA
jgi:hypothetical protein